MRRLFQDEGGAVALIFALVLLPVLLGVGAAIDYSAASNERVRMTRALDAAALAGASQARESYGAGDKNWSDKAASAAAGAFNANLQIASDSKTNFTAKAVQDASGLTVSVSASVDVPTSFMRLAGISAITVANGTSASTSALQFTDIHLVVDNSPSMGIGATKADQDLIYNKTGCQIACHYNWGSPGDTLAAARSTGAVLRLDVVKTALAQSLAKIPKDGRTRVAIYTLGNSLTNVFALSNDLNAAAAALNAIELANANAQGGSNFTESLKKLNQAVSPAGDGSNQAKASGVVILATDAVEDNLILYSSGSSFNWGLDPNYQINQPSLYDSSTLTFQTLNSNRCTPIKAKGYNFFTLEVAYIIPNPVSSGYDLRLNFIKNTLLPTEIPKAMADCASKPENYYRAETPADIANAVSKIFGVIRPLRLVN